MPDKNGEIIATMVNASAVTKLIIAVSLIV